MLNNLLYLRKPGGIPAAEWEQAILATPGLRIVHQLEEDEDYAPFLFGVHFAGPSAEVLVSNSGPRTQDENWLWTFFYSGGSVQFEAELANDPQIRAAALALAERLHAEIVDPDGNLIRW